MGLLIDLHVHTLAHSPCSMIEPDEVVGCALRAGLDGVVITEHYYQWRDKDLGLMADRSEDPHFLILSGFEYGSRAGDILIYGLTCQQANNFPPGLEPEEAVHRAQGMGGACVAAHPTRAGMGFDKRIYTLPLDAVEVASVNLREHEQRLARQVVADAGLPAVTASDAHHAGDIGRYATEFECPVQSIDDLVNALKRGKFRPQGPGH